MSQNESIVSVIARWMIVPAIVVAIYMFSRGCEGGNSKSSAGPSALDLMLDDVRVDFPDAVDFEKANERTASN